MSYRLEPGEPVPEGIRRIAREQLGKAARSLEAPEDPDEAVHDVRKRFKKLRGLVRLVRDEVGEDFYKRENVRFRDAARRLAPLRDRYVHVKTVDALAAYFDDQLYARTFAGLREALAQRHQATAEKMLDGKDVLAGVAETIEEARARVAGWPVTHDDFSAVQGGLHRVYRRGYKRFAGAYEAPSPAAFHEWRKRVKYLWYHARLLRPVWTRPMKALARATHDLSDLLGDLHDLDELRALVLDEPGLCEDERALQVFVGLVDQRRAALQAQAHALGARVYAEKPGAFVDRIAAYWATWREAPVATDALAPESVAALHE